MQNATECLTAQVNSADRLITMREKVLLLLYTFSRTPACALQASQSQLISNFTSKTTGAPQFPLLHVDTAKRIDLNTSKTCCGDMNASIFDDLYRLENPMHFSRREALPSILNELTSGAERYSNTSVEAILSGATPDLAYSHLRSEHQEDEFAVEFLRRSMKEDVYAETVKLITPDQKGNTVSLEKINSLTREWNFTNNDTTPACDLMGAQNTSVSSTSKPCADEYQLRVIPLYSKHKLCSGCKDWSWNAEVWWGASVYAELNPYGAVSIHGGLSRFHGLRSIQFCMLPAMIDAEMSLDIRLHSNVYGNRISNTIQLQPFLAQREEPLPGLLEVVQEDNSTSSDETATHVLDACRKGDDAQGRWVLVRISAKIFAVHGSSRASDIWKVDSLSESTEELIYPPPPIGKQDLVEDTYLGHPGNEDLPGKVNVVASVKAGPANQTFPNALVRRQQAYMDSLPGSGRVHWFTGDREPIFWDRISFINSDNHTTMKFFLNNIQLIVDPYAPISGLTYGPSKVACDSGQDVYSASTKAMEGSSTMIERSLSLEECEEACILAIPAGCTSFNYNPEAKRCGLNQCSSWEVQSSITNTQTYFLLHPRFQTCPVHDPSVTGINGSNPACTKQTEITDVNGTRSNHTNEGSTHFDFAVQTVTEPPHRQSNSYAGVLITLSVLIGLMCICASPVLHSIYCSIPNDPGKCSQREQASRKAVADTSCSDPTCVGNTVSSKTWGKSPFVFVVKFGTKQRIINFQKLSALEEQESKHEERSAAILHRMQPGSFTGVDYLDVDNEGLCPATTPMALSALKRARSASRVEGRSFHENLVDAHGEFLTAVEIVEAKLTALNRLPEPLSKRMSSADCSAESSPIKSLRSVSSDDDRIMPLRPALSPAESSRSVPTCESSACMLELHSKSESQNRGPGSMNSSSGMALGMQQLFLKAINPLIDPRTEERKFELVKNFDEEVTLGNPIGSGGFGTVYEGSWKGKKVAVKMMGDKQSTQQIANFKSEADMLSGFDHPCIVNFLGACFTPPRVCLIEELCKQGSLDDALYHSTNPVRLTYAEIIDIHMDVAAAIAYLHPDIVHKDLKPSNILLKNRRCKVADFGIAKWKYDTYMTNNNVAGGTAAYMAPELLFGERSTERVDTWSFGVVMWECLAQQRPWSAYNAAVQIVIAVAINKKDLPMKQEWPKKLVDLMRRCLDRDPARRPSFIEIMQNLINIRSWLDSQNLLYEHPPSITMDELVRHSSLTEDKGLGCGVVVVKGPDDAVESLEPSLFELITGEKPPFTENTKRTHSRRPSYENVKLLSTSGSKLSQEILISSSAISHGKNDQREAVECLGNCGKSSS